MCPDTCKLCTRVVPKSRRTTRCSGRARLDGGSPLILVFDRQRQEVRLTRRIPITVTALLLSIVAGAATDARRGLFTAPGAVDVVRRRAKGGASLEYYVKEVYPAETTLAFIQAQLARAGFRPVRGRELGRSETTAMDTGWTDLPGQNVSVAGRIWSARWVDARGNEVVYTLSYASPQGEQGMKPTHVSVGAWYRDRAAAARAREEIEQAVDRLKNAVPPK